MIVETTPVIFEVTFGSSSVRIVRHAYDQPWRLAAPNQFRRDKSTDWLRPKGPTSWHY